MWAHSLRIRGPRQSIPIALVGSKETSDLNTSEVECERLHAERLALVDSRNNLFAKNIIRPSTVL